MLEVEQLWPRPVAAKEGPLVPLEWAVLVVVEWVVLLVLEWAGPQLA